MYDFEKEEIRDKYVIPYINKYILKSDETKEIEYLYKGKYKYVAEYHVLPFYYDGEDITLESIEERKHTYSIWFWYDMGNVRTKVSNVDFSEIFVEQDCNIKNYINSIIPKIAESHYNRIIKNMEKV
jgi:hypothetical protein